MGDIEIFPIREKVENRSASSGSNDLVYPPKPVPEKQFYVIQYVSFENEVSAFTSLRVIAKRYDREYLLEEQKTPAAATLYWCKDTIYLKEGEQLIGRFAGCTAADRIAMYVHGYWRRA